MIRKAIVGAVDMWDWWSELRNRWPAIVGVLRGRAVIYEAFIHGTVTCDNLNGAVVINSRFTGSLPAGTDA